jgi:hypothetical protein
MNTRLLGTLCVFGSALSILDGIRWAIFKLETNDTISLLMGIVLDLGVICGLLGLLALKATGTNRIFQALTLLPLIGSLGDLINNIEQLAHLSGPDTIFDTVSALFMLAGLVVVGILTIAAKLWNGWRKFTPLLASLMFPVALLVRSATHTSGIISIFMGAGMMLFGYAVLSSSVGEVKQETAAQRLIQS